MIGLKKIFLISDSEENSTDMATVRTVLAHNQDINSLDVSGDFLATVSQDKTCKVFGFVKILCAIKLYYSKTYDLK